MARYVSNRNSNGLTDENGHFRLPLKFMDGEILQGFTLTANNTMNITISAGEAKIPYADYAYAVWSDSAETITIPTASSSGQRIDRIVAYVDRSMTFTSSTVNHPNALKFMVVSGTASASPSAPSSSTVQSRVGSGNPWISLGSVRLGIGTTGITQSMISTTDRVPMSLNSNVLNQSITATNGSTLQFAIINEGQSLPSAIPGKTLVVLVAKN